MKTHLLGTFPSFIIPRLSGTFYSGRVRDHLHREPKSRFWPWACPQAREGHRTPVASVPGQQRGHGLLSLHSWARPQTAHSPARRQRVHAPGFVDLHVASANVASYEALRKPETTRGSPSTENENREVPCLPTPLSRHLPAGKALAEMSDLCHPAVESPYLQGDSGRSHTRI